MSQATLWKGAVAGILFGVSLLSVPLLSQADEGEPVSRQRVELSLRSWMFTNGETKWSHDASGLDSRLGNPTSKLTYKDNNTQIVELAAKVNLTRRWFLRGELGFSVDFDRGKMVDDDYLSTGGQHLFSRTNSDVTGSGTWYLNLDGGRRVAEFSGNRGYLDVYGGFQYWNTKYEARGVYQEVCNPSGVFTCGSGTVRPGSVLAIVNTTHWITPIRVGTQAEYRLTRWFTGIELRDIASGVRAIRREVLEDLPLYGDLYRFLPVLAARDGYRVRELDTPQHRADARARVYRPSVYFRRLLDLLGLYFLVRFREKPLRFFGLVGALLAAVGGILLVVLFVQGGPKESPAAPHVLHALIVEFLYTFALCYVVLNVATAKGTEGNSFYGLAIGFTVLAGAYSVGHISGGAFNPAVAVGITIMKLKPLASVWIYFVANLAAAVCAALAFKAIHPGEE